MSGRKTPGTTAWLKPATLNLLNKKKRKGETADGCIRRFLGDSR
jgi:hypothetical protein